MKSFLFLSIRFSLYLFLMAWPLAPLNAYAYSVYGIKTDFPMHDGEKVERDIYVNMGTSQGIKVGSKLDVFRTLSTADDANQKTAGNMSFRIGRLHVIHAEANMAVTRVAEMTKPEETPIKVFSNIMVGDTVDVSRK